MHENVLKYIGMRWNALECIKMHLDAWLNMYMHSMQEKFFYYQHAFAWKHGLTLSLIQFLLMPSLIVFMTSITTMDTNCMHA